MCRGNKQFICCVTSNLKSKQTFNSIKAEEAKKNTTLVHIVVMFCYFFCFFWVSVCFNASKIVYFQAWGPGHFLWFTPTQLYLLFFLVSLSVFPSSISYYFVFFFVVNSAEFVNNLMGQRNESEAVAELFLKYQIYCIIDLAKRAISITRQSLCYRYW